MQKYKKILAYLPLLQHKQTFIICWLQDLPKLGNIVESYPNDTIMLNIALFGPPGAGKGTQSELLIKEYGLFYISTGDILRKEIAAQSKLGVVAKALIDGGKLVPDELIVQIIEDVITKNPDAKGFLFDGFPRTYIQAYILEGLMIKLNTELNCLISINVPDEVAIKRLIKRGATSGRSDDSEEVVTKRLVEYHQKTFPVLRFYKERGLFAEVNGDQAKEIVTGKILQIVKNELSKKLFNIVIFGYPGSGRGSQGKALAKAYGLEFVSTGEMLDYELSQQTEIGKQIGELYENGELVPDEIVVELIEQRIARSKDVKGFIFKGYPRTLVQSYILDGLLKKHHSSISKVFDIEVPTLELINRLDARSKTERCMPYDTSASKIVKRLQEHEQKTIPVIEKYKQLHGVTKIDGNGSFDEVYKRLAAEVEKAMKQMR